MGLVHIGASTDYWQYHQRAMENSMSVIKKRVLSGLISLLFISGLAPYGQWTFAILVCCSWIMCLKDDYVNNTISYVMQNFGVSYRKINSFSNHFGTEALNGTLEISKNWVIYVFPLRSVNRSFLLLYGVVCRVFMFYNFISSSKAIGYTSIV